MLWEPDILVSLAIKSNTGFWNTARALHGSPKVSASHWGLACDFCFLQGVSREDFVMRWEMWLVFYLWFFQSLCMSGKHSSLFSSTCSFPQEPDHSNICTLCTPASCLQGMNQGKQVGAGCSSTTSLIQHLSPGYETTARKCWYFQRKRCRLKTIALCIGDWLLWAGDRTSEPRQDGSIHEPAQPSGKKTSCLYWWALAVQPSKGNSIVY